MRGGLRFCPRCRSVLIPIRRGTSIVMKCPKCGYEEVVDGTTLITYSNNLSRPLVTVLRSRAETSMSEKCPRCGGKLTFATSHNLLFRYCANCGFITSEYRPPSYELPADPRGIEVWLEEEERIARSSTRFIGYGKVMREIPVKGDPMIKSVMLDVEVLSDEVGSLRPYDSVYFGNVLGVVAWFQSDGNARGCKNIKGSKCVEGTLVLHVKGSELLPWSGDLRVAEPVMLYESAFRILGNMPGPLPGLIRGVND